MAAGLGLAVPSGSTSPRGARGLRFPLFVKLNREHASLGIQESSRVANPRELRSEWRRLRTRFKGSEILLQEFIHGADVSVALWGNGRVEVFQPRHLTLGGDGRVSTERLKFSRHLQSRRRARSRVYSGPAAERIRREARVLFRALDLSGYARLDYRVNARNVPYLIDINANPNLASGEDFSLSARAAGYSYLDVLQEITELALRYRPRV
jgi:D-alanine-D-alanine ligase